MDAEKVSDSKELRLGRVGITVAPRQNRLRGQYFHVKVAFLVGLSLVVAHDGVYRQTQPKGDGDFELWGTISHAGLDMLGQLAVVLLALVLVQRGRIR